jgi:hypothetical protein
MRFHALGGRLNLRNAGRLSENDVCCGANAGDEHA